MMDSKEKERIKNQINQLIIQLENKVKDSLSINYIKGTSGRTGVFSDNITSASATIIFPVI